MEQAQTIRLNYGDCIHVFNTGRPEQASLIIGPALIVVVKEEASAGTETPEMLEAIRREQRIATKNQTISKNHLD